MALLVIHLWGKFWMAAWRGRRALTWITGVVAFVASVVECFTGYLSQQNFDSQWIATNGKDAFNAVGVGAFFNLMNFGQMLMWHIVLLPIILIAIVGAHVLLVRIRGVSHPLPVSRPARAGRQEGRPGRRPGGVARSDQAVRHPEGRHHRDRGDPGAHRWPGQPAVLSRRAAGHGPQLDPGRPRRLPGHGRQRTERHEPDRELRPAVQHQRNPAKRMVRPGELAGVRQPIDPAQTFVLAPLAKTAPTDPALAAALATYNAASPTQQNKWATSYLNALTKVTFVNGTPVLPAGNYGPVPAMLATELTLARSGAIDADLMAPSRSTAPTSPSRCCSSKTARYYANQATAEHLTGDQWGVMNETGSYPGQPWLWLYQMWYHVPGWRNSANIDLIAIYMTGAATVLLLAIPFIPGLRDIPRWIPVHRLIWRDWNRQTASKPEPGTQPEPRPEPEPDPAGQK